MSPETLFSITNSLALIGWVLLIFSLRWEMDAYIIGLVITLLGLMYMVLVFSHFSPGSMKSFSTLAGVKSLFNDPWVILAGWVHYLAFDLVTGLFIKNNSQKLGIPYGWILPCFFFTFMLGPCGLILYFLIRLFYTRKYFQAY